jgi:hypothetical protein
MEQNWMKFSFTTTKHFEILLNFVNFHWILSNFVEYQKTSKDFANFGLTDFKISLKFPQFCSLVENGFFGHKFPLGFIFLTFIDAKWMKT